MCCRSVAVFSFACVALFALTSATRWNEMKNKHQLQFKTDQKLTRVVTDHHDMALFKSLLRHILVERIPDTPGIEAVRTFIVNDLKNLGWNVTLDQFDDMTPIGRKNFANIIAVKNPRARRWLTLACHYDSKILEGKVFLAATDSAVPCTMMLHLAHKLNQALAGAADQDVTLQLLFLDGEEAFKEWTDTDSLYGARHLAKLWAETPYPPNNPDGTTTLDRIDLFILLDLIGARNPSFRNWFRNTSDHFLSLADIEQKRLPEIQRKLARNGDQTVLLKPYADKYFHRPVLTYGPHIQDDHIPFLHRNVPVIHLISEPFPDVWHRPEDNEANLHWDTIQNLNAILRVFTYQYLHL